MSTPRPRPALDLTRYHARHTHGDITVFLTWYGDGAGRAEPALALVPTYKIGHEGVTPCVVTLSNAWRWSAEIGDPHHCAQASLIFARLLGMDDTTMFGPMRIATMIQDHLGDLVLMPPDYREREVMADAVLRDRDGRETVAEISDRVQ